MSGFPPGHRHSRYRENADGPASGVLLPPSWRCSDDGVRCRSHSSLKRNVLVASVSPGGYVCGTIGPHAFSVKGGPMPLRSGKFWLNRAERARKIAEQMD